MENFRERKLSRKVRFLWRKLSWIACFCCTKDVTPPNFAENFHEYPQNREIHQSFLPQKFPAIQYIVPRPLPDLAALGTSPLQANFDSSLPTLLTRQSISSLSLFSCCVKLDRGDGAMQFYLLPWCPWSLAVCPVLEPLMKCVLELPRLFCKQLRIRNTGH